MSQGDSTPDKEHITALPRTITASQVAGAWRAVDQQGGVGSGGKGQVYVQLVTVVFSQYAISTAVYVGRHTTLVWLAVTLMYVSAEYTSADTVRLSTYTYAVAMMGSPLPSTSPVSTVVGTLLYTPPTAVFRNRLATSGAACRSNTSVKLQRAQARVFLVSGMAREAGVREE